MKVVIVGATSGIAQEVAKLYAAEAASLVLVARDDRKMAAVESECRVLGATDIITIVADLADRQRHSEIARAAGEGIDVVLVAHGVLPDQRAIDGDARAQADSFDLNATSVISIVAEFSSVLETAGRGTIAVIGSVAGDVGRRANYTYGAAKAALEAYCNGLRARLRESGVAVVLVKPGWVDTPMTAHMKKNPLFASPARVARGIVSAIRRKRATVYLPWFWRWIMLAVRVAGGR